MVASRFGRSSPVDETGTRTFAMTVVSAAYLVGLCVLGFVIVARILPVANEPIGPTLIVIAGVFIAIFATVGVGSVVWSGASRRPWFWLVAALPGLLLLLLRARDIPHDLSHPVATNTFLITIIAIPAALAIMAGGIAAFLDVRLGRPVWTRAGRAGRVIVLIVGVVLGGATTSLLAGWASTGGSPVADAPTKTGVLTAEKTRFAEASLAMRTGDVLGLFVTNRDGISHAFDIDALGIHVDLPPDSTTAVAIKPTGPGRLEFYCSVSGHRDAGMVGIISVE